MNNFEQFPEEELPSTDQEADKPTDRSETSEQIVVTPKVIGNAVAQEAKTFIDGTPEEQADPKTITPRKIFNAFFKKNN
jgi:hypothetical protein